jgi:hypothetical protein
MQRIYISSFLERDYGIEKNINYMNKVSKHILQHKKNVFLPVTPLAMLGGNIKYIDELTLEQYCLTLLETCPILVLCRPKEDVQYSKMMQKEAEYCKTVGKITYHLPVFLRLNGIPKFEI